MHTERQSGADAVTNIRQRPHHQVFYKFPCWQGEVAQGAIVNFLGIQTKASYWHPYVEVASAYPEDRYVKTEYPPFDEEYFEWIDLLESVAAAEGQFTMIELGAGWGRWTANAAAALKLVSPTRGTLIAVEAEPSHFRWMVEHLTNNGMDPKNFQLIQAAVTATDGKVGFHVGETQWGGPANFYGHSIGGPQVVDAVSLSTLLRPLATVDLIDLDIQGAEFEVLEASASELDGKVKRVHVGTHSREVEDGIRSLFGRLGWRCIRCFPGDATLDTEWGKISFQDGVQTWLNPTDLLGKGENTAALMEKLQACRTEAARLRGELVELRAQCSRARTLDESSLAWKIIAGIGQWRDRLAPEGTRRRSLMDSLKKRV